MSAFALRYGKRDYPLDKGKFVIGRAETSDLCLDDPLASRSHAALAISGDSVVIEDLGSRNGVRVNGEKLTEPRTVAHGDRIRVGSQEMTLVRRGTSHVQTLVRHPATQRQQAFGVLGGLADKAIAMGHGDEAERILSRQLEELVELAGHDPLDEDTFGKAASYGMKLALLTERGRWLDYVFRLHAAEQRVMTADMVDQAYSLASKARGASPPLLRAYLEVLKDPAVMKGPRERFLAGRIEGLAKLLR